MFLYLIIPPGNIQAINMTANIANSEGLCVSECVSGCVGFFYLGSSVCLWRESLDSPHLLCFKQALSMQTEFLFS